MEHVLLLTAAAVAGAVNSVAGGGTLITFPALVWLGVPSVAANATNTVALWPGSVGSAWGYRRELRDLRGGLGALVVPSLAGGLCGAVLLRFTPTEVFDRIVPILILFATCLFLLQERLQRWLYGADHGAGGGVAIRPGTLVYQFLVGVYGGYFGAGIGILMLAALAILGLTDIHQMNGLKNLLAAAINGLAALYFIWAGLVSWPHAVVMAVGAAAGGVGGAGVARLAGRETVRRIVVAVGFVMAFSLMLRS